MNQQTIYNHLLSFHTSTSLGGLSYEVTNKLLNLVIKQETYLENKRTCNFCGMARPEGKDLNETIQLLLIGGWKIIIGPFNVTPKLQISQLVGWACPDCDKLDKHDPEKMGL